MVKRKPFFSSVKNPGLHMNKYGVVLADRSHPVVAGVDMWPRDWEQIPVPSGNLKLKEEIEDEAREAGYTSTWLPNLERVFKKPVKVMAE